MSVMHDARDLTPEQKSAALRERRLEAMSAVLQYRAPDGRFRAAYLALPDEERDELLWLLLAAADTGI